MYTYICHIVSFILHSPNNTCASCGTVVKVLASAWVDPAPEKEGGPCTQIKVSKQGVHPTQWQSNGYNIQKLVYSSLEQLSCIQSIHALI